MNHDYERQMCQRAAQQQCGPCPDYGEEKFPDQLARAQLKVPTPPSLPRTTQQIQRLENYAMELREELQQCHALLDQFFGYSDTPPMAQPENRSISNASDHLAGMVDLVEENTRLAAQLRRRLSEYL